MVKGGARSAWRLLARAPEVKWQWPGLPFWVCVSNRLYGPLSGAPCTRRLRSRAQAWHCAAKGGEECDHAAPPRSRRPPRPHR